MFLSKETELKGEYVFLQTEVYDDPSMVAPPQFPYQQTPQLFLFSRPGTERLDLDTAATLARRLRGLALLLLVHRFVRVTGVLRGTDVFVMYSLFLQMLRGGN